jgi:hypothetical protein
MVKVIEDFWVFGRFGESSNRPLCRVSSAEVLQAAPAATWLFMSYKIAIREF